MPVCNTPLVWMSFSFSGWTLSYRIENLVYFAPRAVYSRAGRTTVVLTFASEAGNAPHCLRTLKSKFSYFRSSLYMNLYEFAVDSYEILHIY